ncbi:PH domain-containing protein [Microbacterium schleiferi]|uniref:PH domain-containing protein n=1 Tax=Microbacterium schleiferi TaxID=69362 RepID=UPI0033824346
MTNSPEASTPDSEPTATEPAATEPAATEPSAPGGTPADPTVAEPPATEPTAAEGAETSALDEGTFSRILEPRSAGRLPIGDGTWHQLARQYVWVQLISSGILFLLVLGAALAIWLIVGVGWVWIPAGIVLVILAITLAVTPRQARAYGYQLREDDLVFRKGILWQRVVAVPYGRMQLVDITHGPLDRGFGIAQLKLVTAAATTGVAIPGIRQDAAEQLRDTLIAVAETRRTGL